VGAAIALADPPGTGPAVKALGESPDAQVGPAVAVNPAGGSPNILAAVVGTDWRGGSQAPQSALSSGSIVAATGATTWTAQSSVAHTEQDLSFGSPDVAWGPGNKVYAVELGRDASAPADPCASGAGLYFFVSSNGGASWSSPFELVSNKVNIGISDPSITYNAATGRIWVAYTTTDPCGGGPQSNSRISVVSTTSDVGVGLIPSNSITSGGDSVPQFVRPSIAVLPNANVAVAYYDAASNPGRVLVTICTPPSGTPPKHLCGAPVVVDAAALEPGDSSGTPQVRVRPRIAADSSGRIVVTWSEMTDASGMDVFSATSRDLGATFGAPQLVSGGAGAGASNQINPSIAMSSDGRADIAFLDSRYTPAGYTVAASASNRPGGSAESWSQSVQVETTPIVPTAPYPSGPASIGERLGVAEIPRSSGPAWTLISWTDSRGATGGTPRNEDVYSTVLLHGTTAPVGVNSDGGTVPRNVPKTISVDARDADADPLSFGIAQQGTNGAAFVPDSNKPQFVYTGTTLGPDQVNVLITDGTSQTTATVALQVVNTPPEITCTSLSTPLNTAVSLANCATDANSDPISLDASAPQHGKVQRIDGKLWFVPDTGFDGRAQVTLTATDGIDAATPKTITIQVGTPGETPVAIVGDAARAAFIDRPITLKANATVSGADSSKISWSFTRDGKTTDQGPTVAHLFSKVGHYTVTARVGTGPPATVTVFAQNPPISIKSTAFGKDGAMALRVRLGRDGKLAVALLGVRGAAHRTMKLKRGTHTIRLTVPATARARGTVIVKLSLATSGGPTKLRRAVMLPPP
jgi:hypothetical protein